MAKHFSDQQWQTINTHLDSKGDDTFGLPERRTNSVIIGSWNIRKFGAQKRTSGSIARSQGSYRMIENFCIRCDLLAVQEVLDSLWSIRFLRDRMNELRPDADYRIVASDITGETPGMRGAKERLAFIYNAKRVKQTDVASDITYDKSAVQKTFQAQLDQQIADIEAGEETSMTQRLLNWIKHRMPFSGDNKHAFVQFKRSPHIVTFQIKGKTPEDFYDLACINAHLVSGHKKERANEFFALLEWLFLRAKNKVQQDAAITLLLADLNLDFDKTHSERKDKIKSFLTSLNRKELKEVDQKVNFPFLDTHPDKDQPFRTNSREKETYDHIAWFANDRRLPRGHHNKQAGTHGKDDYDYGMFNFVKLFRDAGVITKPDGSIDFTHFEHDFSDHMPIWIRLPVPHKDQTRFPVD